MTIDLRKPATWGIGAKLGAAAAVVTIVTGFVLLGQPLWTDDDDDWPAEAREFVERLPKDLGETCVPIELTADLTGQTAALQCRLPELRSRAVRYDVFRASNQVRRAFDYHANQARSSPSNGTCQTNSPYVGVWQVSGVPQGRIACYFYGEERAPVFIATVPRRNITIFVVDPRSNLSALHKWWDEDRGSVLPAR